jgi:multidrug efflux pump subunit AcrB
MLRFLIKRPVAVLLSTLGLVILGLVVVAKLPVSLLPEVPIPVVTVQVNAPDHTAREIEDNITRPLRNSLMQVEHLEDVKSVSRDGVSQITLFFEHGTNTDLSLLEVNEKADLAANYLPRNIQRPRVLKSSATDIPIFHLHIFKKSGVAVLPENENQLDLAALVNNVIKRRIEQLDEVAFVDVSGYQQPEIAIRPKPDIFHRLKIDEEDLSAILTQSKLDLGNVVLQDGHYQYNVRLTSELNSIGSIRNITIRNGNRLTTLGEIADVDLVPSKRRGMCIHNGHESIVLTVRKQADARIFSLRKSIASLLQDFRKEYPHLEFELTNDQSEILDVSVKNLATSLQWGAFFAVLVLLAFFKEWRSPVLMALVIPVSLVIALFGFFLLDISINVISLSGLILGVGLMIDNSIIIIENIRQFIRLGRQHEDACVEGPEEVIRPLISSALTTCSVFVPLIFLSGLAGSLFYDQAVSVTLALGASLLTAYILLPTLLRLNSKWMKKRAGRLNYPLYEKLVDIFLNNPLKSLGIVSILGIAIFLSYRSLPIEAFPEISRQGVAISVDWNEPVNLEENKRRFFQLTEELKGISSAHDLFLGEQQFLLSETTQATNQASALIYGNEASLREKISAFFSKRYPSATFEIEPINTIFDELFGGAGPPLIAHLQNIGTHRTPEFDEVSPVINWLSAQPVNFGLPATQKQYTVKILRNIAIQYGVPHRAIVDRLKSILEEYPLGTINDGQQEIPVVSVSAAARNPLEAIGAATVTNAQGLQLPLRQFIAINQRQAPRQFTATRSGESYEIKFFTWPGAQFSDALRNEVKNTRKLVVHFSGQYFKDLEQVKEITGIAMVSLLLLYLILAAQFESLLLPFIVILTVPIGIAGALLALELTGQSLNLVSLTGMVVMGGIVVNDAILKVDMMQRLSRHMPLREAIHQAGARRLRPIIMTTATTILALLPILFSGGLGAELQKPLALAVMGGLTAGTLASLFVVPVLFQLSKKLP